MVALCFGALLLILLLVGCDDTDTTTEAPPPPDAPAASLFTDAEANAVHPIAGRSAFPERGEDLTDPMPAVLLSERSQFLEPIDPDTIPALVPWQQAGRYLGYPITVEGRIVAVGRSRSGGIYFLNFHEDWRGKFYMVIFKDFADTLDRGVPELFEGRLVHVTGTVQDYRGRPQIVISSMDQVQFVDE